MPDREERLRKLTFKGEYGTVGERVFHTLQDPDQKHQLGRLQKSYSVLVDMLVAMKVLSQDDLDSLLEMTIR